MPNRPAYEAEALWNVGKNYESALASVHRVTEALAAKDFQAATEALAYLHQFLEATYSRVLELVDFFTDSVESSKSEAILLQKELR